VTTNITPEVMIDMLSLMSVYDARTVGKEDVTGWLIVADLEDWDAAAVQRIIVEHYRRDASRPRLSPSAVTDRLRQIRRAAADTFEDPIIPADLPGPEYPAWYRAQMAAHIEQAVTAWAATGLEPRRGAIDGNRAGTLGELINLAPERVRGEVVDAIAAIERRRA